MEHQSLDRLLGGLVVAYPDSRFAPMYGRLLGGYQLMVSADIFRGRYRESFEHAKAIQPDTPHPAPGHVSFVELPVVTP